MDRMHLHHSYDDGGDQLHHVIPTPAAGATAWSSGVSGAGTKYTNAVQSTQKDQAALAVAQQAAMVSNFNNVVNSGEWARRLLARGTPYWRSQTLAKVGNYTGSATTGKQNYENAASQLYPYEANLQAQVAQAKAQGASSLQRFQIWMDGMIAFKAQYTP